ncbi:MAG: hypothetical protein SYNGOMJ08_00743 [Candidatus Syntrophoarchaeum sp. GoM_oil]|nr:MAG: hypothetical protein SYNGOMJ08_00743 [Candidatus Syntrophoarchaeum sp. GoM_oil]
MNKLTVVYISLVLVCIGLCHYYYLEIEQDLNETAESILQNSKNDTEKVHNIIAWENNNLSLTRFESNQYYPRRSRDPHWYIFLKKANCGERAIIFEDMAERTNITYRKLRIDGYIDPANNNIDNHRWFEVWLECDWRIADSGYNLSYPKNNQSYFTSVKEYLIGHVAILSDNGTFEDCTDRYVNETSKLIIHSVKDGKNIEDADISIKLTHKNLTCPVVGKSIKYSTNDSGLCEINLGIYNETYYTVDVSYESVFYNYSGRENVTIINKTTFLVIELDKLQIKW